LNKVTQAGKGELAFAGFLLLLGLVTIWDTSRMLVPSGTSVISPKSFSYVIGSFLAITSVLLISEILRGNSGVPEGTEAGDPFQKADFKTMAQVVAAICANVILLDLLGFIVAATVSFWGVAYAFGARKYLKDLLIAIVFSVFVYFGFTQGLNINLPAGIFADLTGK
jgi:putative tricarboxylic transport membrane protein